MYYIIIYITTKSLNTPKSNNFERIVIFTILYSLISIIYNCLGFPFLKVFLIIIYS